MGGIDSYTNENIKWCLLRYKKYNLWRILIKFIDYVIVKGKMK